MAAITHGTTCLYGVAGTVSNLYVQSYTVSASFENTDSVNDETGITKTVRQDNRKTELSIEGIVKVGTVPVLGAIVTFTVAANSAYPAGTAGSSYSGFVTKIEEKGGSKEFVKCSISVECYEGISS